MPGTRLALRRPVDRGRTALDVAEDRLTVQLDRVVQNDVASTACARHVPALRGRVSPVLTPSMHQHLFDDDLGCVADRLDPAAAREPVWTRCGPRGR